MEPASPNTSGGRDSSAKNAASAASPVTRLRKQVPTVETTSRQVAARSRLPSVPATGHRGLTAFAAMALR